MSQRTLNTPDETCRPSPCWHMVSCEVHAPTSAELIASGWPEPPAGWAEYDKRAAERKEYWKAEAARS